MRKGKKDEVIRDNRKRCTKEYFACTLSAGDWKLFSVPLFYRFLDHLFVVLILMSENRTRLPF